MMRRGAKADWMGPTLALLLACAPIASAAERSALSRWLGDVATPEIRQLLAQHPRYAGQPVHLVRADGNGLAEALVTLLTMNLQGRAGIDLVSPAPVGAPPGAVPVAIDAVDCGDPDRHRLRLRVSAAATGTRRGRVQLELLEPGESAGAVRHWEWRGRFTRAEQETLETPPAQAFADGSLAAPWTGEHVDTAARELYRQLVCALRPQVVTRLDLAPDETASLPPLFADTFYRSLHLLGDTEELGFASAAPDFRLGARVTPFREDIWQFWLTGSPLRPGLEPVQAVTYFRAAGATGDTTPARSLAPAGFRPGAQHRATDRGAARSYLTVEMLDAWLADARAGSADLVVQVQLENRADRPIEYAFRLSGGHYQHCIPEPAQYRHHAFGRLRGRLAPGERRVGQLVIDGARHRPDPWLGARSCAGFRSLDGFEDFPGHGDAVTEYVRWQH